MKRENRGILQAYYETLSAEYEARFEDEALMLRKAILPLLIPKLKGRVLCVGWSNRLKPTPPGAEIFVVADFAEPPLRSVPARNNVRVVQADVEKLPFDVGTFNTVLVPNLLHLLAEDSMPDTDRMLARSLKEITRVMKGDGTMIFVEPLMNPVLETMNRALYPVLTHYLNSRGRPVKSYYSASSMKQILFDAGLSCEVEPVDIDGKSGIFNFMPDLRVPAKIVPYLWKHSLVYARKRHFKPDPVIDPRIEYLSD